jgi:hypothetical protein
LIYRYGLHARPPGPVAIPTGFLIETWTRGEYDEIRGHRWGTIDYSHELTLQEIAQYELKAFVPCYGCFKPTADCHFFLWEGEQYCHDCYMYVVGAAERPDDYRERCPYCEMFPCAHLGGCEADADDAGSLYYDGKISVQEYADRVIAETGPLA